MKYIKLFEELNTDIAKKYPHLFNLFVDPQYIKEDDYEIVDNMIKEDSSVGFDVTKPLYIGEVLFDLNRGLNLSIAEVKKGETLPEDITINGNFILIDTPNITNLPRNMIVKGDLTIDEKSKHLLHDSIKVEGDIIIHKNNKLYIKFNDSIGNGDSIIIINRVYNNSRNTNLYGKSSLNSNIHYQPLYHHPKYKNWNTDQEAEKLISDLGLIRVRDDFDEYNISHLNEIKHKIPNDWLQKYKEWLSSRDY